MVVPTAEITEPGPMRNSLGPSRQGPKSEACYGVAWALATLASMLALLSDARTLLQTRSKMMILCTGFDCWCTRFVSCLLIFMGS